MTIERLSNDENRNLAAQLLQKCSTDYFRGSTDDLTKVLLWKHLVAEQFYLTLDGCPKENTYIDAQISYKDLDKLSGGRMAEIFTKFKIWEFDASHPEYATAERYLQCEGFQLKDIGKLIRVIISLDNICQMEEGWWRNKLEEERAKLEATEEIPPKTVPPSRA